MLSKAQTLYSLFITQITITQEHTYTHPPVSTSHKHSHRLWERHTHFPLAVLLCFVRINEKSSLALGVISVLGVK